MWNNYLKIAWRNLWKHKGYALINIMGLAFGIACCLLILMYVAEERNYDRGWADGDRIFRMSLERIYPDRRTGYATVPQSYAQSVKNDCPEVAETARIFNFNNGGAFNFKYGEQSFEERNVLTADSTFFNVFKIPLLHGSPDKCLSDPDGLVVTESAARRFFGDADPMGKDLFLIGGEEPRRFSVTGVCADLPDNVHFGFEILLPSKGFDFTQTVNHIGFAAQTYFLLHPGADPKALEAKFPDIVEKYAAGEIQRNFGVSWPEYKAAGNGYRYYLTALRDIHLHSNLEGELKPPGSAAVVGIFSAIALFILLLACINFMNLATARSAERAREVGIRKVLGSQRRLLAGQFLVEAVLVSSLSAIIALGLVALLLPSFNELADKELTLQQYMSWLTIPGLAAFAIGVGLAAGIYPAGVLSGFQPLEVLKGKFTGQKRGVWLRNGLVVFQFSASIIMIISTLVVFSQLNFISGKKLGFQKEHILVVQNAFTLQQKTDAFKQELKKIAGVEAVGGASEMPGGISWFGTSFKKPEDNETVTGRGIVVDDQLVETLRMELVTGRSFSEDYNDSLSVVLNEKAVKDLGLGPDPVGKRVVQPGSFFDPNEGDVTFTVVGVLRDFHFQSLHEPIVPLFVQYHRVFRERNNMIAVRVQPQQFQSFIQDAEKQWRAFVPDQAFQYTLLDADLAALYATEKRLQRIFILFALLAVFIACIGLLGLAAYITQQHTKEIGIRKVLGASVASITGLLAKDFLKLVFAACVLASPAAYYLMHRWLAGFAYRIELQWWMFALAGIAAISIAALTVSFQSIRAALANPVESLRNE
ncbi:MAG: ABC transporter permease [Saprospiraceae bacterium]|nr:ABC transporter permease [Saprospiraceae bacterium]